MKKTLPSIRLEEKTITNMKSAVRKYNKRSLVEISFAEYRRLCYEVLSQMILRDFDIPIKIIKNNSQEILK